MMDFLDFEKQGSSDALSQTQEGQAIYLTRILVSLAVLIMLASERIFRDPERYRKASLICLLAITGLVIVTFMCRVANLFYAEHIAFKLAEALWVLLNCTVAYFPSKILGAPAENLNMLAYCCMGVVVISWVIQLAFTTTFNAVYVANAVVSGYTIMLLYQLIALLQRESQVLKAVDSLYFTEYLILFLNVAIVFVTIGGQNTAYPLKVSVHVIYWIRIHTVLVEYGRRFINEDAAPTGGLSLPYPGRASGDYVASEEGRAMKEILDS
mmetsp:Transcript_11049/g.25290  ORF Transcript_11049/g.25290 Transcript_11049/m.25290 type:complete len:268 (-) Transcript_11049:114-917(-)|eukprot:CAMPEP_0178418990 /NCGR_PEP_ID=MMETSP0689_2-20121128/25375_1 /TAXON_ID=160604 /ORGANISM="Amphidinium massartii, Strain CS-259" /LENGTH=267 /DNA_ID=CAMNT_0020040405 /DNA_START=216 /DNA_END=1019 /DNA_ORIENTATION=+